MIAPAGVRTFLNEISDFVDSFSVESPSSFTLLGARHRSERNGSRASGSRLSASGILALQHALYRSLHSRYQAPPERRASDSMASRELVAALSMANHGRGPWQAGWTVRGVLADQTLDVEHNGIRWIVSAERFRGAVEPGVSGQVRVPKEQQDLFTGYYMALGNADDVPRQSLVRVYWHVSSEGAVDLLSCLTQSLNTARVPFRYKTLKDPATYQRADAAVAYIPRDSYDRAAPHLAVAYRAVRGHLRPGVSAFAKQLAPGVGLAEDTGPSESYGQQRCRLLAAALTNDAVLAAKPRSRRLDMLIEQLLQAGIRPDAPYLNNGSTDGYERLDG